MIIVSQYREMILNFDKVCVLSIDDKNTKKRIFGVTEENNIELGEYATEERAKEVLQEIIEAMYPKSTDGISFRVNSPLYYMPKE